MANEEDIRKLTQTSRWQVTTRDGLREFMAGAVGLHRVLQWSYFGGASGWRLIYPFLSNFVVLYAVAAPLSVLLNGGSLPGPSDAGLWMANGAGVVVLLLVERWLGHWAFKRRLLRMEKLGKPIHTIAYYGDLKIEGRGWADLCMNINDAYSAVVAYKHGKQWAEERLLVNVIGIVLPEWLLEATDRGYETQTDLRGLKALFDGLSLTGHGSRKALKHGEPALALYALAQFLLDLPIEAPDEATCAKVHETIHSWTNVAIASASTASENNASSKAAAALAKMGVDDDEAGERLAHERSLLEEATAQESAKDDTVIDQSEQV